MAGETSDRNCVACGAEFENGSLVWASSKRSGLICDRCAHPDYRALAARLAECLGNVKEVVERSDAPWWMDCPDRGGFDLEKIDAALAAYRAAGGEG